MLEDNLGRDTQIEKNARTCNQNRRQKNKPRKNTDLSKVGTVFKSLRKRHSSIGPALSPNTVSQNLQNISFSFFYIIELHIIVFKIFVKSEKSLFHEKMFKKIAISRNFREIKIHEIAL